MKKYIRLSVPILVSLFILAGCGGTRIETANDIVTGLAGEGMEYANVSPANTSKLNRMEIDEAIVMEGDSLNVEIFRIEHEKHFKMFASMGVFLSAVEVKVGQPLPGKPDMFVRKPFIIIVRQEAEKGQVKAALKRIFPAKEQEE